MEESCGCGESGLSLNRTISSFSKFAVQADVVEETEDEWSCLKFENLGDKGMYASQ